MKFSIENLIGQKYNKLTIIGELDRYREPNGKIQRVMSCSCDCGNTCKKYFKDLRKGMAKSCGCLHKEQRINTNKEDKYGMLTIIKDVDDYISPSGHSSRKVLCSCECGNKKEFILNSLRRGKSSNCGCKLILTPEEIERKEIRRNIYSRLKGMRRRCYNTENRSYKRYGGRGITIAQEWLDSFENFYQWAISNGFKKELQIDRRDNNGNYEPDNCRFVTNLENQRNK